MALILVSCSKAPEAESPHSREVHHGMIELGEKLNDPYTVDNMQKALSKVYPTKAERIDIHPTDYYVRFLPADDAQLKRLEDSGLYLMDHPMDYRIKREGDYYMDPSLADDAITWQYAVVPRDYEFPEDIRHEVLDRCYISEHDPYTRAMDIDWLQVEKESFVLTGNGALWEQDVKSGVSAAPKGRITFSDPAFCDGRPVGVAGVTVACNVFVKVALATTDRDGYYKMETSFSSDPRYRLVFKNTAGFSIGLNLVLIPASVSTLGSGTPAGIDFTVTESGNAALFRRTAVNNAAYDYITRCNPDDLDISAPPKDLRIWIIPFLRESSAPMLHHGTVLDQGLVKEYVGKYAAPVALFAPDVTIGTKDGQSFADIYASTVHEMAHTSHFVKAGSELWTPYIAYILKSFVMESGALYGSGPDTSFSAGVELFQKGAGVCEISEMWAYFVAASMHKERYGGSMPSYPAWMWFRPEILGYLYERGTSRGEIFRALGADVCDLAAFKKELLRLYPERDYMINQAFAAYGK